MSIHPNHRQATGRGRVTRAIKSGFAAVALTSAVTALGAIVGAGSASAATAAPAVTGVTWHQLIPINGWQSGESHYGTGSPAWTVRNGVVYLSGSVLQPSGNSGEFAVLPPAARPSRVLYIAVYTLNDTQGFINIDPNGAMYSSASPYSHAQGFTSLAGISFPAPALTMRFGRNVIAAGAVLAAAANGALYLATAHGGTVAWLFPGLVLLGAGQGLCITPLTTTVLGHADPATAGSVSGALSTAQQVGNSIGVAVTGVLFFGALGHGYGLAFERSVFEMGALLLLVAALTRLMPGRKRTPAVSGT